LHLDARAAKSDIQAQPVVCVVMIVIISLFGRQLKQASESGAGI